MNQKKQMIASLMAYAMYTGGSTFMPDREPKGSTKKDYAPWAGEHLPKKLRKGKTYEEIQELRKQAWAKRTGNKIEESDANSGT